MDDIIHFQDGLVLFSGTYFIEIRLAIVLLLLLVATAFDIRSRRIPNWLVFSGALIGIVYHALSPYDRGTIYALEGLAVGFIAFLPLYILRAMGAGDVKLMAMAGAFLGPASTLSAVLLTFIAGGVLAIVAAVRNGAMQMLLKNVRFIMTDMTMKVMTGSAAGIEARPLSAGKVPYALAIAIGTAIHIFLMQKGYSLIP